MERTLRALIATAALAAVAALALLVLAAPAPAAKRSILYVADRSGTIWSHPAGGSVNQVKKLAKGKPFVDPTGIEADTDGTLWIADPGARAIFRLDPATGRTETVAKGASISTPVDLDRAPKGGPIYVLDSTADPEGLGAILEIDPKDGTTAILPTTLDDFRLIAPTSIVLADAGTAYITDGRGLGVPGVVFRVDLATGVMTVAARSEGLIEPKGIDLGSDGLLYVTDQGDDPMDPATRNRLLRVNPGTAAVEFLAIELPPVLGVVLDRQNQVFATTGASPIFGSPILTQIRNGDVTKGVGGPFRDPVGVTEALVKKRKPNQASNRVRAKIRVRP
ncbi:MAG: Vgb family protein [Solirubrobacterales bacterium]